MICKPGTYINSEIEVYRVFALSFPFSFGTAIFRCNWKSVVFGSVSDYEKLELEYVDGSVIQLPNFDTMSFVEGFLEEVCSFSIRFEFDLDRKSRVKAPAKTS